MNIKRVTLTITLFLVTDLFAKKNKIKNLEPNFIGCFFSHGLGGSAAQGDWYAGFYGLGDGSIVVPRLIPYELFSFNYREITDGMTNFISLGQDDEVAIFDNAFNATINSIKNRGYKDENIHLILCGVSRGASTIINWISRHPESLKYVLGVILESPFDSVESVFEHLLNQMQGLGNFVPKPIIRWLVKRVACGAYDENGLQPIYAIKNIEQKNIPILFIWSKTDTVISYKNSKNLYLALRRARHTKLSYLECEKGTHGGILWGPEGNRYKEAVQKFLSEIVQ